jgi:hypothetical protein
MAVGMALGVGSAMAADFNAGCCADLDERIAELEVMTARKGTRNVSLTISGLVNRIVLHVDDGKGGYTYYGLESANFNSRFGFRGEAMISSAAKVGFEIVIRTGAGGGNSGSTSQLDEDGKINSVICPSNCASFNAHNDDPYFGSAQTLMWWIESEIGRLTVGRGQVAGVQAYIDLTGFQMYLVASPSFVLLNGGFFIRGPSGQYYSMVWGNIGDPAAGFARSETVRYDSPTWNGFIYSASIAEAGDYWGTMIRYAGDHRGFRVAGQVGYERSTDIATPAIIDPTGSAFTGRRPDVTAWGFAISTMHNPTGLFVQSHYNAADYGGAIIGAPSGYWGEGTQHKKPGNYWLVQGGISKNWFNYGRTTVYGEYGMANDWGADFTNATGTTFGRDYTTAGFMPVRGVTETEMTVWGFGIAQDIDAANTTLYAGYRHFSSDIVCTDHVAAATCSGGVAVGAAAGTFTTHKLVTEGADVILMGTRVRF